MEPSKADINMAWRLVSEEMHSGFRYCSLNEILRRVLQGFIDAHISPLEKKLEEAEAKLKDSENKREALEYALNHRISEIKREARNAVLDELEEWRIANETLGSTGDDDEDDPLIHSYDLKEKLRSMREGKDEGTTTV